MAVSNVKAVFCHNVQRVWDIVTSLENYQWRSDLSKIEVISGKQFVEYEGALDRHIYRERRGDGD